MGKQNVHLWRDFSDDGEERYFVNRHEDMSDADHLEAFTPSQAVEIGQALIREGRKAQGLDECDECGKYRKDVKAVGRDANGDPDAPSLCYLCRKKYEPKKRRKKR